MCGGLLRFARNDGGLLRFARNDEGCFASLAMTRVASLRSQ